MFLIAFILCCVAAFGTERLTYSRNGDNLRFEWDDNSRPGNCMQIINTISFQIIVTFLSQ